MPQHRGGEGASFVADVSRYPEEGALQSRKAWGLGKKERVTYE